MNYILIVVSTLRYDLYKQSNTPNMNKISPPVKAHSPTSLSSGSMFFYLHNQGPLIKKGRTRIIDEIPEWTWLPECLQWKGYKTGFITTKSDFYTKLSSVFTKGFDEYIEMIYTPLCSDFFIDKAIELIEDNREPYFYVIHVCDTHEPYRDGNYTKAVEAIDRNIGKLLEHVKDCKIVIVGDNGMLMNEEGNFYDEVSKINGHEMVYISPILFRVPLIKGEWKTNGSK